MDYFKKYNLAVKLIKDGYLLHCTNEDIDTFDPSFIKGGMRAREGYGFYFSDMPYKSIEYGDNIYMIKKNEFNFLNLEDEIDVSWFDNVLLLAKIGKLEDMLYNCRSNREYDYYTNEIEKLKSSAEYDEMLYSYVCSAIHNGAQNHGQLQYLISNPEKNLPKIARIYMKHGYDGGYYDGIYTVFNFDKLNEKVIKYNPDKSIAENKLYGIIKENVINYLNEDKRRKS